MWLYPRLPRSVADHEVGERATLAIRELAAIAATAHPESVYGPTGGGRVAEGSLRTLRETVVDLAKRNGYPRKLSDTGLRAFDAETAVALHTTMGISPSEASRLEVWSFVACILLPDIVRWRFPGDPGTGTSPERFLGGIRGLRNTFGRLWWRAELLQDPVAADPYAYVRALGEDELVQITERPNLAGNRIVSVATCRAFLEAARRDARHARSELLRDAMKRIRRIFPLVALDAIDEASLGQLLDDVFAEAARSLASTPRAARG